MLTLKSITDPLIFQLTVGGDRIVQSPQIASYYFDSTDPSICVYQNIELTDNQNNGLTGNIAEMVTIDANGKIRVDESYYTSNVKGIILKLKATTTNGQVKYKLFPIHDVLPTSGNPILLVKSSFCKE